MPEEDGKTFYDIYQLYEKWRGIEINTIDLWMAVTNELYDFVVAHGSSPLAVRLAIGVMDTFDDLYKDGLKPAIADYFGRSDL